MTTLVIGGAGVIGTALTDQLVVAGEDVVCFDVDDPHRDDVTAVRGDVTDREALAEAVRAHSPERLVHLAALIGGVTNEHPDRAVQVNCVGTDNALSVALDADLDHAVWASTLSVYGTKETQSAGAPVDEESVPAAAYVEPAASVYAASKQFNERQARAYADKGLDVRAVRPSVVFSPARKRGWRGRLVEDALAGTGHIPHPPDETIGLVYATDAAALFAAVVLTDETEHRAYNTGGHAVTMREVAEVVEAETGGEVTCDPDGPAQSLVADIDNTRARREFGYELTPLDVCIRDYVRAVS